MAVNTFLPRAYIGARFSTGINSFTDYAAGSLDEIMIFNRILSSMEINAIYVAGSAGICRAAEFLNTSSENGKFEMTLRGLTGKNFTIYESTNLLDWTLSNIIPNPNGTVQLIDTAVTNLNRKFYRASQ